MQTAHTDAGEVKYWTTTIKVRKPHRCSGCGREIKSGETCEVQTQLYDGAWDRSRTCAECVAWIAAHPGYFDNGEWHEGDIADAMREEGNADA